MTNDSPILDALRGALSALEWHTARHGVGRDAEICRRARAALALIEAAPDAIAPQPAEPYTVQGCYWTDRSGNTYSRATVMRDGIAMWATAPTYGRDAWRGAARRSLFAVFGIDPERARRIVADASGTEVRGKRDL